MKENLDKTQSKERGHQEAGSVTLEAPLKILANLLFGIRNADFQLAIAGTKARSSNSFSSSSSTLALSIIGNTRYNRATQKLSLCKPWQKKTLSLLQGNKIKAHCLWRYSTGLRVKCLSPSLIQTLISPPYASVSLAATGGGWSYTAEDLVICSPLMSADAQGCSKDNSTINNQNDACNWIPWRQQACHCENIIHVPG